jgi:DNA recombination protein RmuC
MSILWRSIILIIVLIFNSAFIEPEFISLSKIHDILYMEQFIFLIIGIILGLLIGKFWTESKLKNAFSNNSKKLEYQLQEEKIKVVQLQGKLDTEAELNRTINENMKSTFESLSAKVMQSNNQAFIQLANETLKGILTKAESDYKQGSEAIHHIVKPLKESIERHEKLVSEFQEGNSKAMGSLKTYLEELGKSQKSLEKETGALVNALKSPKVRGRWGEIGLKRIVEFSGMSSYCDFEEQTSTSTEEGRLRPDMIINLPENRKIIVDSKVPLNAYLDALETSSEQEKIQLTTLHSKAVQTHMKNLSAKAYWSQFDNSIDFVVLYIEVESAFAAALHENPHLITEGLQNRIVFATPTTLITLLQTVAYSWKQQKAGENARKIFESSRELHERLIIFNTYLQKLGQNLNSTVSFYNQAVGSWESRVSPSIKKMEELGALSDKNSIKELEKIEKATRELKEDNQD